MLLHIIKSELQYRNKLILIVLSALALVSTAFILITGFNESGITQNSLKAMRVITGMLILIIEAFLTITHYNEKRERLYALLPVNRRVRAFIKRSVHITFAGAALVIFFSTNIIARGWTSFTPVLIETISLLGVILILTSLLQLLRNIYFSTHRHSVKAFVSGVFAFFMLAVMTTALFASNNLHPPEAFITLLNESERVYFSLTGAFLLLAAGLLISLLSFFSYQKRIDFTE